jgi:predicted permease
MVSHESPLMHRPSDIETWLVAGQTALVAGQHAEAAAAFALVQAALPREITVALMVANAWRLAGNTVAFAAHYRIHPEKAATTVFFSMFIGLVYIPVFVALFIH